FFDNIGNFRITGSIIVIFAYLLWLWLARETQRRPIFLVAVGLAIAGLLLFLIGFIAELVVSQGEHVAELERMVSARRDKD
ncbi:MAG: hypothetical protein HGA24_11850, partial [Candidatus Aminicenantes bacterium]|nr:hypothetical protein [Candidatus Aminicenantes bacterium]